MESGPHADPGMYGRERLESHVRSSGDPRFEDYRVDPELSDGTIDEAIQIAINNRQSET